MADLTEEQASIATKISGSDLTGVETNYVGADSSGNMNVITPSNGPVTPGTVATKSDLAGGQFNTVLPTLTNTQQAAIQLDSSGRQLVNIANASIPVTQSGTWTTGRTWTLASGTDSVSAVQSGTWNINNISGTISLPTGASTSALQTTGNTSLASIVTNTNGLILAQGSTTSGQTGNLNMGAVTTAAPSYTTGQTSPFSLTTAGALRVDLGTSNINVNTGVADKTAFTYGTTIQSVGGGVFQDTSPALTAGTQGAIRLTANRAQHMNLRDASGNELLAQKTMANSVPVVIASDQSTLNVKDASDGPVTPGTVAANSSLIGGQFNTALPTLTNTQQSALQLDSSGRLIVTIPSIPTPSFSNKFRAEPTTTTIAIPSTSTYTTVYTYTGSGLFIGWNGEFSANRVVVKMVMDGTETIFDADSITLNGLASTSSTTARYQGGSGFMVAVGTIDISFRYPIKFNTSIVISAKLTSGASINFQQGIMYIQKDT